MKTLIITICAAVLASACGGGGGDGGSSSSPSTFDTTEFQGTWLRNDGTASGNPANCFHFTEHGGAYGGLNRPSVITANTLTSTVEVYSGYPCVTKVGLLIRTYSVAWSAGSVVGKTNVAKVLITSTGYTNDPDGGAGYTMTTPPVSGVATKGLLDVNGLLLYTNAVGSPTDADGYPTTLSATALYTR